jgi:hypothetical protein
MQEPSWLAVGHVPNGTMSEAGFQVHIAIEPDVRNPGKRNTQRIERKHLTLRMRIKRLARKTSCFSKSIPMHDIVIGLFVNRYEFGLPV